MGVGLSPCWVSVSDAKVDPSAPKARPRRRSSRRHELSVVESPTGCPNDSLKV